MLGFSFVFRHHFTKSNNLKTVSKPGDVLLSHGETPHYHRRYFVSLLSSEWIQVGPKRYGRQANSVFVFTFSKKVKAKNLESCLCSLHIQCSYIESIKTLWVLYG